MLFSSANSSNWSLGDGATSQTLSGSSVTTVYNSVGRKSIQFSGVMFNDFVLISQSYSLLSINPAPINGTVSSTGTLNCGSLAALCIESYLSGTTITLITTPDANYSFNSWSGGCSESFIITGDMSCSANFRKTSITLATATGSGDATIDITGDGCHISNAQFVTAPAVEAGSANFPHGLVDFTLTGCTGQAVVTITYPLDIAPNSMKYWKEKNGIYTEYPAIIGVNSVTFTLTDNGTGDTDPTIGVIRDPGGIGFIIYPIPTLSVWMLLILSGLLALVTVFSYKNQERS